MPGGTPGVAGAVEIERWRGPAALDRPGLLQDNLRKQAKEKSAHGRRFISVPSFSALKPPEDSERHHDGLMLAMAWRFRADGSSGFLNKRRLECAGLSLDQALGWGWTVAIQLMT
jgi:hypothetical protein